MSGCLLILFTLAIDFLITTLGFWLILQIAGALGWVFVFTWGKAFAFWGVIKILKILMI